MGKYFLFTLNIIIFIVILYYKQDGNEPIVTHGFTLTSSIKFRDIIETVYTYGFAWSKYPIIISIENHCNKEN